MSAIVFTGGGTGGHVYPGLAVYERLSEADRKTVVWIASRRGVECEILAEAGIPYRTIPAGKLRRYVDVQNFWDLFRVGAGFLAARRILRDIEARVLFSKGGFVAVPVVAAAWTLGIPVIIHESDADPGLATRLSAPAARRICVAYPETKKRFPRRRRHRVIVTGNPVRREFVADCDSAGDNHGDALNLVGLEDHGDPVLLVTGGSLGAQQLNEIVREEIEELTALCVVVHQTGAAGASFIPEIIDRARPGRYGAAPSFNREFARLLQRADLVISRAGAGALWEFAVTGTPSILIPLSRGASRGDQIRNAHRYAGTGAAVVLDNELPPEPRLVTRIVRTLLQERERRQSMGDAARRFAGGDGAERIAGAIGDIIHCR